MTAIVITGASSGIGAALTLHYAGRGITLGLTGRDTERLESIALQARAKGAQVETKIVSVVDQAAMNTWLMDFDSRHPIDLLIANAGVSGGAREPTPDALTRARAMFDINITGVLNTIDPVIPLMALRGRGQIAMVASLAGFMGNSAAPAYNASKGFVRLYGEGLRGSLESYGIKVSVICPGFVRSRITDQNKFPMPFFMEADRATRIIAEGLQKNRARIAFPWPMYLIVWFLAALPAWLAERIVRLLPVKTD